jgi:hypothetical protein
MAGKGEGVTRVVSGVMQQLRLSESDAEQNEHAEEERERGAEDDRGT